MAADADYLDRVRKYAPGASPEVVAKIVRHLGIALQSRDASLVACSDSVELDRVREKWLKKKLGRTETDATLDASIAQICERMKADRSKCRVVFYYLLAEKYGKLHIL